MTAVSVVIPTFNRAHVLPRAVASVASAQIPVAEVIVVDDGSTDDTAAVAASMSQIRYVRQDNMGAAAARNRGIAEAKGDYVIFLDSDDRLLPGAHAELIHHLNENPQTAVGFPQCRIVHGGTDIVLGYLPTDSLWRVSNTVSPQGIVTFDQTAFFRSMLLDRCFVHIGSVVRKSAVDAVGGFNPTFRGYEEWDLYVRIAARFQFAYSTRPGLEIHKHDTNMSKDGEAMMVEGVRILDSFLAGDLPVGPIDRAQLQAKLEGMSMGASYAAFARGDHSTARRRLAIHITRFGLSRRAAAYYLASYAPPFLVAWFRFAKGWRMFRKRTVS